MIDRIIEAIRQFFAKQFLYTVMIAATVFILYLTLFESKAPVNY